MSERKTHHLWVRTSVRNLVKHSSVGYYAPLYVGGKEQWKSLRTKAFEVAKARLREEQRNFGALEPVAKAGRMTVGMAIEQLLAEAYGALRSAATVIGIPRISHHDLRDLFATTAIESGVDIPTVADWLGHQDGGERGIRLRWQPSRAADNASKGPRHGGRGIVAQVRADQGHREGFNGAAPRGARNCR